MTHPKYEAAMRSLDSGDAKPLIAIGMRAALSGERCSCVTPEVVGFDLMCTACLCENDGQRSKREAAMMAPHEFVQREREGLKVRMCEFCSGWRNDPRHGEPSPESPTEMEVKVREIVDRIFPERLRHDARS